MESSWKKETKVRRQFKIKKTKKMLINNNVPIAYINFSRSVFLFEYLGKLMEKKLCDA